MAMCARNLKIVSFRKREVKLQLACSIVPPLAMGVVQLATAAAARSGIAIEALVDSTDGTSRRFWSFEGDSIGQKQLFFDDWAGKPSLFPDDMDLEILCASSAMLRPCRRRRHRKGEAERRAQEARRSETLRIPRRRNRSAGRPAQA